MMQKYRYRFGAFIDLPSGPGAALEQPKIVWYAPVGTHLLRECKSHIAVSDL